MKRKASPRQTKFYKSNLAFTLVAVALLALAFQIYQIKTPSAPPASNELPRAIADITVKAQVPRALPDRLLIPKIHVDAAIEHLGLTARGAVAAPANNIDVGWYQLGPTPGEVGSAVIDGHLGPNGAGGIFQDLHQLKIGDEILIRDQLGTTITFRVWQTKTYASDAQPTEVFNKNDGIYLNLITCEGTWDARTQSYGQRLVVFTSIQK